MIGETSAAGGGWTPADPPAGPDTRPRPGARIGHYRIEETLGFGGMAEVFRALDERLGRQVALKVITPRLASDGVFRARFIRESRAAARVDHPNIIPVYEAGEEDGALFIAMRYVSGGDVKSLLTHSGPLAPARVVQIVGPVAAALDAAHAAGLVHRDVKPGNVLLDASAPGGDHVYLTDFGITRTLADGEVTDPGLAVGTPNYMAPEQIEGRAVDGRSDQYALACSAFEMMSGAPPFSGSELLRTIYAHVAEPPPALTSRRPELPRAVDVVFARALAKAPADRFATCRQFAEALATALGQRAGHPGATGAPGRTLSIPLKSTFRYIHEPCAAEEGDALTSLGNDALMAQLQSRIMHSRGGTFLITGFRGVGKSTLVLRALDEIVARSSASEPVLHFTLSVARSTTTERLLFAIVRRIFETLSDSGVLYRLAPQTRHALLVAYMRTSLSFKQTQSEAREHSTGVDLSVGPGKAVKAIADIAMPKVSMSAKLSHSLATEAAFLAYSETDVEYDLMRIVSLVDRHRDSGDGRRAWLRRLQPWRRQTHLARLHLIIVLDEVDKLTADAAGLAAVHDLLSGIKNVLTMSGVHFLVVAGPDLHDQAVRDAARGIGVYESVFGWRLYVPCIWDAPDRLVANIISDEADVDPGSLDVLVRFLSFKARGVARRLLQEANGFITWEGDRPVLRIDARDMERVEFYARLENILRAHLQDSGRHPLFPVPIDEDRWRLGGYYVVDWVLQSEGEPFTAADLLRDGDEAVFDPILRISRRNVDSLLDHLAKHRILDVVRQVDAASTVYGDIAESSAKVYCLADEIRHQVYGFAVRSESERAIRDVSVVIPVPRAAEHSPPPPGREPGETVVVSASAGYTPADTGAGWTVRASSLPPQGDSVPEVLAQPPTRIVGGRYELRGLLGQGGLSTAYKGLDHVTGRQVVVKLLRPTLANDPVAVARFRREAEVAKRLSHPQVARTFGFLEGTDDGLALVTEWLNGPTLAKLVTAEGPMNPGQVAAIGRVLASALAYIASEQVLRLDLKPSNIVMADRGPVIIDLGIAFRAVSDGTVITDTGQLVGTPAFMAPELIQGIEADARADIYGLGLVLYYCLAGKTPWEQLASPIQVMSAAVMEGVDAAALPVSPEFKAVLRTAVARSAHDRFPDAAAFADALGKTPEWRSVADGEPDIGVASTRLPVGNIRSEHRNS